MKAIITTIVSIFLLSSLSANNVEITQLTQNGNQLTFQVTWENSWRSGQEFHDAVWVFVKQAPNGGPAWTHANILNSQTAQGYDLVTPSDKVGVFLRRASNGNGTASAQVQVTIDNPMGAYRDYKVFGIEMVYVEEGAFSLGDGASSGSFHKGDDTSASYLVNSEDEITIGSGPNDIGGSSSFTGTIASSYPKGYNAFYCMKYKITQRQIVDFLNCLTRSVQDTLIVADLSSDLITNTFVLTDSPTIEDRNGVRCESNVGHEDIKFYNDYNANNIFDEEGDGQSIACNYIENSLYLAYCDWSGLGPMTRFEYEKACRGPLPAVANEFAWGSSAYTNAGSINSAGQPDEKYSNSGSDVGIVSIWPETFRVGLNATGTTDRQKSGATYYGILDMTSTMNEKMVSVFNDDDYDGAQGDGLLKSNGRHNMFDYSITFFLKKKYAGGNGYISSSGSYGGGGLFGAGRCIRRI